MKTNKHRLFLFITLAFIIFPIIYLNLNNQGSAENMLKSSEIPIMHAENKDLKNPEVNKGEGKVVFNEFNKFLRPNRRGIF